MRVFGAGGNTIPGSPLPLGWRVWAFGLVGIGLVGLAFGEFDPGQPVPKGLPARPVLALAVNLLLVLAGLAVQARHTVSRAAAGLAVYYLLVVVAILGGRVIATHPKLFEAYSGTAEQLALGVAGLIVWASAGRDGGAGNSTKAHWIRAGQGVFGACAVLFGVAHFVYADQTIPLVPGWLPPSATFWAYATGVAHMAAGLAIASGVQARLAATLLTVMYAAFTPLVHVPLLLKDPHSGFVWSENALNLALTGAAWVVRESLDR